MRSLLYIIILLFVCAISLGQNDNEQIRAQLDSMRKVVLAPKLKLYTQRVEKFTNAIKGTDQKHCVKMYARNLVQVTDAFQDDIAALYDCYAPPQRGGVYLGMGMGPWMLSPAWGGYAWGYPYNYYPYGPYDCLPRLFYEVDKVRKYANSMRLSAGPRNVSRKLNFIGQQLDLLKDIEAQTPAGEPGMSVR